MKLVLLNHVPIFEQLELEEALLRSGTGEWAIVNTGSPPAIIMGISGKKELLVEDHSSLPLIRRFSGGGCVVVDEETIFITFIGDLEAPTPCKIHQWALKKLKGAFENLPFELRENDYVIGDKKFGGNAQYIAKNRCLHHSSLLWKWDSDKMELLKHPAKKPAYREERTHGAFLTDLKGHFPSKELFMTHLVSSLFLENQTEIPTTLEIAEIMNTPHRKTLTYC